MSKAPLADLHLRLIELLRRLSVRTGSFTLASGRQTDFYVDARQTTLNGEGAWLIGQLLLDLLAPDIAGVGGVTLGADPIASATAAVAHAAGRPLNAFLVRKQAKGHGTGSQVEGLANLPPGSRVAVVEDTTTTGGSLLFGVERAREAGLVVAQCITVVDREEGAAQALSESGLVLQALVTRTQLLAAHTEA